jgi:hypothetical protein
MVLLEPALTETLALTLVTAIREGLDEVVRRGVPPEAARDFLLGHVNITFGILFGFFDATISDGARLATERARQRILRPDWRSVFEPENILNEIRAITRGVAGQ